MSEEHIKDKDKKSERLKPLIVFQFNDELNEFQELELEEDIEMQELLDPDFILLCVDFTRYRVWIWHGSNTTTRMKFIAAKLVPSVRGWYGIDFKIAAVDEDNETLGFKIMIGLEEEPDNSEVQTGPAYEETQEDLELLESLYKEKILLLLERAKKIDNSSPPYLPEVESERKLYCNYCGSKLVKEQ